MSGPGQAVLAGTELVADDLYLMAHDDVTGRPFLQPRAADLGLAGGLLAEQISPGSASGTRCRTGWRSWPAPPRATWPPGWSGPGT